MKVLRPFILAMLFLAVAIRTPAAGSFPAVSLQHLLTEHDCESMPELLGDWKTDGDLSGTFTLVKLGNRNYYRLLEKDDQAEASEKHAIDICVAHLGPYLFFDATFQEARFEGKIIVFGDDSDAFGIHWHFVGRLEVEKDALHFRLLNDNWLQDALKTGSVKLTCTQDDNGEYFLTAPSSELKKFVARFATDPKAFSYAEDFARAPREKAIDGPPRHTSTPHK